MSILERLRLWLGAMTLLIRALGRCFFGALAAAVTVVFFTLPPQGKELLALVVENANWSAYWWISLLVSAAAVAMITWYSSRVLMDFHDLVDRKLQTRELVAFGERAETWLPRILGALCILPLPFFLADVGVKTYILNSPLLIVAAFALFAALDTLHGCIRCSLYRWGFLWCLVFVLAAHRWATEVPFGEEHFWSALPRALFTVDESQSASWFSNLRTTGVQLIIGVLSWVVLDYVCRRWLKNHRDRSLDRRSWRRAFTAASGATLAALIVWLLTFWRDMLPRTWFVVPLALVVAIAVIAFFVHRRDWFPKMVSGSAVAPVNLSDTDTAGRNAPGSSRGVHVAPVTKALLSASLIAGTAIFVLVVWQPIKIGRWLGTPSLLMLALGIWVVFGGVVLTILPKAYGFPALGLVPLIVAGCNTIGDWPITISQTSAAAAVERDDVIAAFDNWRSSLPELKAGPLYLVAAAGGGIRAAFLTASYLAAADDVSDGKFGRRVFAISGVSGGSLGAATYAILADDTAKPDCEETGHQGAAIGPRQLRVLCALDQDFLSPAVATLLFPDLFRAFWVHPWIYQAFNWQDRGRTLEQAWTQTFDDARSKAFDGPFLAYIKEATSTKETHAEKVNLILNSTGVQSGQRVVTSTFEWPAASAIDLLNTKYDTAGITLVGAVHNSARFTYVSPAGAYYYTKAEGGRLAGQVADGGYFDNSGGLALIEIVAKLRGNVPDDVLKRVRFVIITNDGAERMICDDTDPHKTIGEVQLTAPIATFFAARTARAELSKAELRFQLAELHRGSPCNGGEPVDPLIEVSLNNDLVARFLRQEKQDGPARSACEDLPTAQSGTPDASRKVTSDKEIAVRVNEAPLGWTLSAATVDWLTRYALKEACKLRSQLD